MSFTMDATKLLSGLQGMESKADIAVRAYAETSAELLETQAKENARWTDRTGNARRGLKGDTYKLDTGFRIRLAHSVNYGANLEYGHEKRYAIIIPTIQENTDEIMQGFNRFLNRIW